MPISVKHDLSKPKYLILHKILIHTSPSPFNPKHFKRTRVKTETRKHYNLRNREGFKLKAKIDDKRQGPCPALTRGLKILLLSPSPSSFSGDSKVMRFRTCNVDTSHANNIKDGCREANEGLSLQQRYHSIKPQGKKRHSRRQRYILQTGLHLDLVKIVTHGQYVKA
ncbi:hypothetical protein WN943_028972 [Citrus x changshan-huyou]